MNQPIITTDISSIRPVFDSGTGENIKRYKQLQKMFSQNKEYSVLAEPMPAGGDKLTWFTKFEGVLTPYSKLSADEQNNAKGKIKYQVNKLYKATFRQLYKGGVNDVRDMFAILDAVIEIPDYEDIWRVKAKSGEENYVLINWGFTSDDFNAHNNLIQKLVPVKVDTVKIKVIKNGKAVSGENISVNYKDTNISLVSDKNGFAYIEDINLGFDFKVSSADKKVITDYIVDGRDEYEFVQGEKKCSMKFSVIDSKGNPMPNEEMNYIYQGKNYFVKTDDKGMMVISDIAEGAQIELSQKNNTATYICNEGENYIFNGTTDNADIEVSLLCNNRKIEERLSLKFSYQGRSIELNSFNGVVNLENMPTDTDFNISTTGEGYRPQSTNIQTVAGLNKVELTLMRMSKGGSMIIRVVDAASNPIADTQIKNEFGDKKVTLITDVNGEIVLDGVNFNDEVVCTQIINGLGNSRCNFVFTEEKNIYILKGLKIPEKSVISNLEIHVTDSKKRDIPNLRINTDDGHVITNRITDNTGRVLFKDIKRNKKISISTEYKNKTTTLEYECKEQEEFVHITVGGSRYIFLLWLIPLLLILAGIIFYLFGDKIKEYMASSPAIVDTTQMAKADTLNAADTIAIEKPVVNTGIKIIVSDEKSGNIIKNAKVELSYKDTTVSCVTDNNGTAQFADVPQDTLMQISAKVNADGFSEFIGNFTYQTEKEIKLNQASSEVSDVSVSCGTEVKSKGYHSTIQTVNVKKKKGILTLGFATWDIPDEVIVYKGKASDISEDKIIWKSKGFVKGGYRKVSFSYKTTDGIITVRVNGGDDSKTEWYFKVYCP